MSPYMLCCGNDVFRWKSLERWSRCWLTRVHRTLTTASPGLVARGSFTITIRSDRFSTVYRPITSPHTVCRSGLEQDDVHTRSALTLTTSVHAFIIHLYSP